MIQILIQYIVFLLIDFHMVSVYPSEIVSPKQIVEDCCMRKGHMMVVIRECTWMVIIASMCLFPVATLANCITKEGKLSRNISDHRLQDWLN